MKINGNARSPQVGRSSTPASISQNDLQNAFFGADGGNVPKQVPRRGIPDALADVASSKNVYSATARGQTFYLVSDGKIGFDAGGIANGASGDIYSANGAKTKFFVYGNEDGFNVAANSGSRQSSSTRASSTAQDSFDSTSTRSKVDISGASAGSSARLAKADVTAAYDAVDFSNPVDTAQIPSKAMDALEAKVPDGFEDVSQFYTQKVNGQDTYAVTVDNKNGFSIDVVDAQGRSLASGQSVEGDERAGYDWGDVHGTAHGSGQPTSTGLTTAEVKKGYAGIDVSDMEAELAPSELPAAVRNVLTASIPNGFDDVSHFVRYDLDGGPTYALVVENKAGYDLQIVDGSGRMLASGSCTDKGSGVLKYEWD